MRCRVVARHIDCRSTSTVQWRNSAAVGCNLTQGSAAESQELLEVLEYEFVGDERALPHDRRGVRSGIPGAVTLDRVIVSEEVVRLLRIETVCDCDSPSR